MDQGIVYSIVMGLNLFRRNRLRDTDIAEGWLSWVGYRADKHQGVIFVDNGRAVRSHSGHTEVLLMPTRWVCISWLLLLALAALSGCAARQATQWSDIPKAERDTIQLLSASHTLCIVNEMVSSGINPQSVAEAEEAASICAEACGSTYTSIRDKLEEIPFSPAFISDYLGAVKRGSPPNAARIFMSNQNPDKSK